MGITQDDLGKQYQQMELQAQAAIKANEYLANILEVLQGKTPDHNPLTIHATDTVAVDKPFPVQVSGPTVSSQGGRSLGGAEVVSELQAIRSELITLRQQNDTHETTQLDIAQTNR